MEASLTLQRIFARHTVTSAIASALQIPEDRITFSITSIQSWLFSIPPAQIEGLLLIVLAFLVINILFDVFSTAIRSIETRMRASDLRGRGDKFEALLELSNHELPLILLDSPAAMDAILRTQRCATAKQMEVISLVRKIASGASPRPAPTDDKSPELEKKKEQRKKRGAESSGTATSSSATPAKYEAILHPSRRDVAQTAEQGTVPGVLTTATFAASEVYSTPEGRVCYALRNSIGDSFGLPAKLLSSLHSGQVRTIVNNSELFAELLLEFAGIGTTTCKPVKYLQPVSKLVAKPLPAEDGADQQTVELVLFKETGTPDDTFLPFRESPYKAMEAVFVVNGLLLVFVW